MKIRAKHNASVLLLVMGLLTIIALLGASFVLVATMDRKTARSINAAMPMDAIARELLGQVVAERYQDLYIGSNGPYSAGDPNSVAKTYDYPSEAVDPILSSAELELGGTGTFAWRHLTNMGMPQAGSAISFGDTVPITSSGLVSTSGIYRSPLDGNIVCNDAVLFRTGNKDSFGRDYNAAVRVIDASGLLNVNTAGWVLSPITTSPTTWNVTNVTLNGLMKGFDANSIVSGYRGSDLASLYTNYVQRPWTPIGTPTLFNTTDLANIFNGNYNLWDSNSFIVGQFGQQCKAKAVTNATYNLIRPYITTYSASRVFSRAGAYDPNITMTNPRYYTVDINTADANALYRAIYAAMPHRITGFISSDANRQDYAAQLAVNIIAFRSTTTDVPTFTPPGSTKCYYGLTRQPFLTKVQYKRYWPDANQPNTYRSYSAIELWNPYDASIDLMGMKVKSGSSSFTIPISTPLAPYSRAVIKGATGTNAKTTDIIVNTTTGTSGSGESATPAIAIDGGSWGDIGADSNGIVVQRPISSTDSNMVCIAATTSPNPTNPPATAKTSPPTIYSYNEIQCWNDSSSPNGNKFYYASNKFKAINKGPSSVAYEFTALDSNRVVSSADPNNHLGISNVSKYYDPNISATYRGCPIYIRNGPFVNIGEISKIYFVGPDATTDIRKKLDDVRDAVYTTGPDANFGSVSAPLYSTGRFDPATGCAPDPTNFPGTMPRVSIGASLCDYLTVNSTVPATGTIDPNVHPVVYGKINVNTAPSAVLKTLPGIGALGSSSAVNDLNDANILVNEIKYYRDANTFVRLTDAIYRVGDQRLDAPGFASIGEIALPLQVGSNKLAGMTTIGGKPYYNKPVNTNPLNQAPFYYSLSTSYPNGEDGLPTVTANSSQLGFDASKRNQYFNWLSNQITIRSDVFIVFIRVQLGGSTAKPDAMRRYIAVIDRSQCKASGDRPKVLLFAQMRN